MNATRLARLALAATCLAGLSACVSLLPESEPVGVYRLSSPEPREWTGGQWQTVEIEAPQAPRGLSGPEIALMRDGRIAYVAGARWIAPSTHILQDLVVETFGAADSHLAPTRPEDGTRSNYSLRLDLHDFHAEYDRGATAAPLVRVRLAARLIDGVEQRLLASRMFSAETRASAHSTRAIVTAFDAASMQVAQDLAAWTEATTQRPALTADGATD
ncbi:ABC-type transport auxiliary lipoprotein family protein [Maricaulis sp. CAU 1757]